MKQGLGIRVQGWRLLFGWLLLGAAGLAQEIQFGGARVAAKGHVALLTDSAEVKAGREQLVELRFRVDPGFHINSHTPKDELLIPTILKAEKGSGVDVLGVTYPVGSVFRLSSGETLDVYQGEFLVVVRLIVDQEQTTLMGSLRYQACDDRACFPPKLLPVRIALTGK